MGYRKLNFGSGSQAGLSLVELMIALVLGLLLSTGVVTIFISAKQDYQVQDAISQVQENGRFSLEFLAYDIRMAGFSSCGNDMPTANAVENAPPSLVNFQDGIEGFDGDNDTLPTERFPGAYPNTDAIVIHSADMSSEVVVEKHKPKAATIDVTDGHGFKPGAVMMIVDANCSNRGIFVVTGPTNNKNDANHMVHNEGKTFTYGTSNDIGNCTKALKGNFKCTPGSNKDPDGATFTAYSNGSSVFAVTSVGYYIRDPAQDNDLKAPTLYKIDFSTPGIGQPLVEGISDLDVLYGVYDESADTLEFKDADVITAANEWGKVTTVQLEVVADSLTQVDGAPVTRRYVRTVEMRNR